MTRERLSSAVNGITLALVLSVLSTACVVTPPRVAPPEPTIQIDPVKFITWEVDMFEASKRAGRDDKMILVYFYQPNNDACDRMTHGQGALNIDENVTFINERMVPIRIDANDLENPLVKEINVPLVTPSLITIVPTEEGGAVLGIQLGYASPDKFENLLESSYERWGQLLQQ